MSRVFKCVYPAGDILSFTETTNENNINVFIYTEYLFAHSKEVLNNPKNYLPWPYDKSEEEKKAYWKRVDRIILSPSNSLEAQADEHYHSSG